MGRNRFRTRCTALIRALESRTPCARICREGSLARQYEAVLCFVVEGRITTDEPSPHRTRRTTAAARHVPVAGVQIPDPGRLHAGRDRRWLAGAVVPCRLACGSLLARRRSPSTRPFRRQQVADVFVRCDEFRCRRHERARFKRTTSDCNSLTGRLPRDCGKRHSRRVSIARTTRLNSLI